MITDKDLMFQQMADERETLKEQHHKLFIVSENIGVLLGELSEKIERIDEMMK